MIISELKCCVFLFLCRMVSSYLVHHGFSATAEIFAKITGQTFTEDLSSIKNRQSMFFRILDFCFYKLLYVGVKVL